MDDCIFCKIANGEIPSSIFYETEDLVAFDDLNPPMPVHCLIVPKAHYANLAADVPGEVFAKLFAAVPVVAHMKGIDESGYRVVINTGKDAGQTVQHLHVHVLGGAPMSERMFKK